MPRKQLVKLRGRRSFQRRAGHKAPRSITLIVCEGETEQIYFRAVANQLRLTSTEVVIADDTPGSAPINVVNHAQKKGEEQGGYDSIFCVMDRNGHTTLAAARDKINQLKTRARKPLPISEVLSVPCFEVWVLLHYEFTEAPFENCAAVIARVGGHLKGYKKADATVIRQLLPRLQDALTNAARVATRAATNNYNPYTQVHNLIAHLQSVATT